MKREYDCPLCDMKQVEVVSIDDIDECTCLVCGHEWDEYKDPGLDEAGIRG